MVQQKVQFKGPPAESKLSSNKTHQGVLLNLHETAESPV